jgi:hypothetical protein
VSSSRSRDRRQTGPTRRPRNRGDPSGEDHCPSGFPPGRDSRWPSIQASTSLGVNFTAPYADAAGSLAVHAPVVDGRDRHAEVLGEVLDAQQRLESADRFELRLHALSVDWMLRVAPRRRDTPCQLPARAAGHTRWTSGHTPRRRPLSLVAAQRGGSSSLDTVQRRSDLSGSSWATGGRRGTSMTAGSARSTTGSPTYVRIARCGFAVPFAPDTDGRRRRTGCDTPGDR